MKYRVKIVRTNLLNSFPEKSKSQLIEIEQKFYHHFCDLLVESTKLFSISQKEAVKRAKILNPEVMNSLFDEGKSLVVVGGHYNNWEMLAVAFDAQVKHNCNGIYTALSNKFFDKKFYHSRGKYGMGLIRKKEVSKYYSTNHKIPIATLYGADQSPSKSNKKSYWTKFLNQETAIPFGAEKYATEFNHAVVYVNVYKIKRGFYEMKLELLEENPTNSKYGSITEKHVKALETQILEAPEYWLWTHRRWKLKKPKD